MIAADIDGLAPALYVADRALRVPPVSDPSYSPSLLDAVGEFEISLIVPTIDPELPRLAEHRRVFQEHGCLALVSSPELVCIANDKWLTVREFSARGFTVPRSWLPDNAKGEALPEQLFLKPRDGSASQHTLKACRADLDRVLPLVPNPIIQECLTGPELTVDALLDLAGRPIHYVVRRRIKTVGGESVEGVTLPPEPFHAYLVRLLETIGSLGGIGPITIQLFLQGEEPVLSEINPRFGGGFPLALAAGARYPEWILDMVEGKAVEPKLGQYRTNLYMTRYYCEIIRETPLW